MNRCFTAPRFGVRGGIGLAFLALALSAAQATQAGGELAADQPAVTSTNELLTALRAFERAPETQRPAALQRLMLLADQRRQHLMALIDQDPQRAAIRVLPAAVLKRFPAQLQATLEREAKVSGTVRATVADDIAGGHAHESFALVDDSGRALSLGVAGASRRELLSWVGRRASVAAVQVGERLLVLEKRHVQLLAADGTPSSSMPLATAASVVQGDQSTLVVLLNFTDKAIACTASDVQGRLFGGTGATLNQGYLQSSGNKVSFSGKAIGPFTINYSSTGACDPNGWAAAANAAATAAGFSPSGYQRVSYALPGNANCGWSGLAALGGPTPSPSWVQNCTSTGLFSHELGHNLGLHHASTPTSEYGDSSDPMGGSLLVQSNGMNRAITGWVDGTRLKDIGAGGSYAVDALEYMSSANPLVLRLPKADTAEYYYISLRQGTDLDAGLPSGYKGALSIHHGTGTMPAQTFRVANLAAGQSWTDSVNGITVTHQGLTTSGATVGVSLGGAVCTRAAPTLGVSPGSQSGAPGAALNYTVAVKNNNAPACASSSFNLSQVLPAGFSGSFSPASVTLAPGGSGSVVWSVASPASAVDATYTLAAAADESGVVNHAGAQASYTVVSPVVVVTDSAPPTLAITSPAADATVTGRSVSLTATVSDASGVASVQFHVDGKLLASDTAAPYSANWNLRKVTPGQHSIRVRATDTVGNSVERSITVTVK